MEYFLPSQVRQETPSTHYFLGLYLVLLAFFVFLTSISNFETKRSNAVIKSMVTTFSSLDATRTLRPVDTNTALEFEGQVLQDSLVDLFGKQASGTSFETLTPGQVLEITVNGVNSFSDDDRSLEPGLARLTGQIAAILRARPVGGRFEINVIVGGAAADSEDDESAGDVSRKAIWRAGAIARALITKGSPEGSVAAGIDDGVAGRIRLRFYVRSHDEPTVDFREQG